jgi:hypothetical protein
VECHAPLEIPHHLPLYFTLPWLRRCSLSLPTISRGFIIVVHMFDDAFVGL